jgi:hypothetical protein
MKDRIPKAAAHHAGRIVAARPARGLLPAAAAALALAGSAAGLQAAPAAPSLQDVFAAGGLNQKQAEPARRRLAAVWKNGYADMFVDQLDLMRRTSVVNPLAWIRMNQLVKFLEKQTGQHFGLDVDAWRRWEWSLPYDPHPAYGKFKGLLYGQLDPRFKEFFRAPVKSSIRLDEVQWGGVGVGGIPLLDHPKHVAAAHAGFMGDDNIVFGVSVDGQARAYPKRILAWHELARDKLGGRELTIVYCTLCGTVIPYASHSGGVLRRFATSGLLYQSNKLMFDQRTHSLWSSLTGKPVIGPLVGSGVQLKYLPVVTTRWGEWRRAHPNTTVLSLDTGYKRDYSEGAAYHAYFSTDALMFDVSKHDDRLPNKAEILALRLPGPQGAAPKPLAISVDFLRRHRVYTVDRADPSLVVVTSAAGANRVYRAGAHHFVRLDENGRVIDGKGRAWKVSEPALTATFDPSLKLPRVPAYRAFWFGWYAQHPDTALIN